MLFSGSRAISMIPRSLSPRILGALLLGLAAVACAGCGEIAADKKGSGKKVIVRPKRPPLFEDVTAEAGIDFTYRNGEQANQYTILETLGGGVALFDFDGDGLLDIFATGGGLMEGESKNLALRGLPGRLYRNLGGLKFEDVTAAVGL